VRDGVPGCGDVAARRGGLRSRPRSGRPERARLVLVHRLDGVLLGDLVRSARCRDRASSSADGASDPLFTSAPVRPRSTRASSACASRTATCDLAAPTFWTLPTRSALQSTRSPLPPPRSPPPPRVEPSPRRATLPGRCNRAPDLRLALRGAHLPRRRAPRAQPVEGRSPPRPDPRTGSRSRLGASSPGPRASSSTPIGGRRRPHRRVPRARSSSAAPTAPGRAQPGRSLGPPQQPAAPHGHRESLPRPVTSRGALGRPQDGRPSRPADAGVPGREREPGPGRLRRREGPPRRHRCARRSLVALTGYGGEEDRGSRSTTASRSA
jgi:hypothetical protein